MSSSENAIQTAVSPWRRALKTAVAALLSEIGYQAADIAALETLIEILQAYIVETGQFATALAELSGRTCVTPNDTVLAIIESGIDIQGIPTHAKRDNKSILLPMPHATPTLSSKLLQVGDKRKHPQHIPDHLPPFPDPHTYIKTSAYRQPANEYQVIRERAASQKRDVEVGLTKFIAKTGSVQSLFKDDISAFPLIACQPTPLPYLSAILPNDYEFQLEEVKEKDTKTKTTISSASKGNIGPNQMEQVDDATAENDTIDNPYLCPVKMTKRSEPKVTCHSHNHS